MAHVALFNRFAKFAAIYHNRQDYFTKTGKLAPEFDWSRPAKSWEDMRAFADPQEEIEYSGINYDANGKPNYDPATRAILLKKFKLYPEVASTVNLIPEPFPADAEMTASQRIMAKRRIPEPLELLPGEKVVDSAIFGGSPEVDDGKGSESILVNGSGGYTEADRSTARDTRALSLTISSRLARIEELLASFQNPAPK